MICDGNYRLSTRKRLLFPAPQACKMVPWYRDPPHLTLSEVAEYDALHASARMPYEIMRLRELRQRRTGIPL